jgi:hypothetical protein
MSSALPHPAAMPTEELLRQCDIAFERRSGPGGQHRNKVSTAVVIEHRPTGVRAEANERRSQSENRTVAAFRLRIRLAIEVRTPRNADDAPSPLWQSRCRGGRIEINETHEDFPAILAESLDALHVAGLDPKTASQFLDCTASQLLKLLKKEPQAWARFQQERERLGLTKLL